MEQIEFNGYELYESLALIKGLTRDGKVEVLGFVNEKDLTEGTKRFANRIAKKLADEVELLNKQRLEIQEYKEDDKSEAELKQIRIKKDSELMLDKIKIEVEKLDFSKVENSKLTENYQILYDKIFK